MHSSGCSQRWQVFFSIATTALTAVELPPPFLHSMPLSFSLLLSLLFRNICHSSEKALFFISARSEFLLFQIWYHIFETISIDK